MSSRPSHGARRLLSAGVLAVLAWCTAATAHAGPRRLLVLRAESSADWATRGAIEAGVVGLARNVDPGVGLSDSTFGDLARSLDCKGAVDRCKGPVLDALSIDEVVLISISTATGREVKVTVQRASKAGTRAASATVDKDDPKPALVASIGPLFGASRIVEPAAQSRRPPPKGEVTMGGGAVVDNKPEPAKPRPAPAKEPEPARTAPAPAPAKTAPEPAPAPARTAPEPRPPERASGEPAGEDARARIDRATEPAPERVSEAATPEEIRASTDEPRPRDWRRPASLGGMAGGAALAILGLVLWQRAGSIEDDVHAAPDRTSADVQRLLELEARGDRYALWGNVTFIGGVVIAGAGGYLFWRSRRDDGRRVHVAPVLLDRGGGIAVGGVLP